MFKKAILILLFNFIFFGFTTFGDYQELKKIDKIEGLNLNSCETINDNGDYVCHVFKKDLFYIVKNGQIISKGLSSIVGNDSDSFFKVSKDGSKNFYIGINDKGVDEYFINSNKIEGYSSIQRFEFLGNGDYIFTGFSNERQKWEIVKNGKIIDENVMNFFTQNNNNDNVIYIKNNYEKGNIEIVNGGERKTINNLGDIIKQKINGFNFEEYDTSKFEIPLIYENTDGSLDYLINVQNYFLYILNGEIYNSLETNLQNIDYSKKLVTDYLKYLTGKSDEFLYHGSEDDGNCIAGYVGTKKIKECSYNGVITEDLIVSPDKNKYYFIQGNGNGTKYKKRVVESGGKSISGFYDNIKIGPEESSIGKKSFGLLFSLKGNNLYFIGEKDSKEVLVKNNKEISEYFNKIEKLSISPSGDNYAILIIDEKGNEKLLKDGIEIKFENEDLEDFGYDENGTFFAEIKDLKGDYYTKYFGDNGKTNYINNYTSIIKDQNPLKIIQEVINGKKEIKIIKDDLNKKDYINPIDEKIKILSIKIKQKYSKKQIEKLIIKIDNLIKVTDDKTKIEILTKFKKLIN